MRIIRTESVNKSRNFWTKALAAGIFSFFAFGCGPNEGILKSGKPDPNATPAVSSVERDVADMATADFTTVFVLRRKDGGKMDAADRSVIRNATDGANRRVGSDDEMAFIIGSNQPIAPEKMTMLGEHFAVQIITSPPAATEANTVNANK